MKFSTIALLAASIGSVAASGLQIG